MPQLANRVWKEGPFTFFRCICGNEQAVNPAMAYCGSCGIEYDCKGGAVIFRPDRKTPRLAIGKAINKAGGIKFGRT